MLRLLFLDAYDSFSNNIVALLHDRLSASVTSIKIHDERFVLNDDAFLHFLQAFDGVVAGPGPGHPANTKDVGLIGKLWHLPDHVTLPVLGICLGFQSLCLAHGGDVVRLREPRHGMVTPITHCGKDIFKNTGELVATQYHSLHIQIYKNSRSLWAPTLALENLTPLAWDLSDCRNGPILMAARHSHKPFWGVQFHPESVCSNVEAHRMIESWGAAIKTCQNFRSMKSAHPLPTLDGPRSGSYLPVAHSPQANIVEWTKVELNAGSTAAMVVEALRGDYEPLLLESGIQNGVLVNPETGRYSIIGLQDHSSLSMQYSTSTRRLCISKEGEVVMVKRANVDEVFSVLEEFMELHRAVKGPVDIPFWGGLVGYLSYELGLETINVSPSGVRASRPDMCFAFVERSVVIDHISNLAYIQSLQRDDGDWLMRVKEKLRNLSSPRVQLKSWNDQPQGTVVSQPSKADYCDRVESCQSHLRAGSSYELCLTDQTLIHNPICPWQLYLRLRETNPAPFGACLRLKSIDIVGSSPERFLSWDRQGACQFRPIKGTVKKSPGMTRGRAEIILSSPKERAENLMIVDLIRHDLHGVPGVRNVQTPTLMSVEEYPSVYQLVSVISGVLPTPTSRFSALARSLPPGSMTGAPKKRSCELLQQLERGRARGLYSGVLGYFDVGGGGDFSVVIRTAFKWTGESEERDVWHVGAGGAVTVLSESTAEWEEMCAKRERLLAVLCGHWG